MLQGLNKIVPVCCLWLGIYSCTPQAEPTTAERPNIILIMADDMGYSDIGCYGSEINTPNLDRLAENGLRFTQFYNTARCCPTRASLLTGLHPHQAGVGHMVNPREANGAYQGDLSVHSVTIAQVLQAAGYDTYMAGKWHVTPLEPNKKEPSKHNWPLQRGFDEFFGTIHGAGSFYDPNSLTHGNSFIVPGNDFYYTDAISDTAVNYINRQQKEQPFFLYVAYTAAHWPMHALPEDIARYKGKYDAGWTVTREQRIEKMKKLGLIQPKWKISKAYPGKNWEAEELKEWHARCMEVYAAMIDNMDRGIGRMVQALENRDMLKNTLVIYLQDNGACAETYGFGRTYEEPVGEVPLEPMGAEELQYDMEPKFTRDGRPVRVGRGVMPGPADTYIGYDQDWSNVGNTPFRMFKHWMNEGGISTPLIVHWPNRIKDKGALRPQMGQLMDIMATCVAVSGAPYPETYNGQSILPMEGVSLLPAFQNEALGRDTLYWEHEGNRAVRIGNWKLVSLPYTWPMEHDETAVLAIDQWQLFDLENDRTETRDLAAKFPEKVWYMAAVWQRWAKRAGVIPKPEHRTQRSERVKNSSALVD